MAHRSFSRTNAGAWSLFVVLALGGVYACTEDNGATAPSRSALLAPAAPLPTLSAVITPVFSNQAVGPIGLGSYATSTEVDISVSGAISSTGACCQVLGLPGPMLDAGGVWSNLYYDCVANVTVSFTSGAVKFCDAFNQFSAKTWTWHGFVSGTGTASLSQGPSITNTACNAPGQPACWRFSGQYTVTVTPVQPATLQLQPTSASLTEGMATSFTASATSGTQPTDFVWTWAGTPQAKGKALTDLSGCVAGQATCAGVFFESGTLTCTATVAGVLSSVTATVTVTPCAPTGDPVLDSPEVRKKMHELMAASNPNATPGTGLKQEHQGVIFKRPDGSYYLKDYSDPNATECFSTLPGGYTPDSPGDVILRYFHTHPTLQGEDVYGCGKINGKQYANKLGDHLPVPTAKPMNNGGGSDPDWKAARTDGADMVILDKDGHTWVLPSNTNVIPVGKENTNPNLWHPPAPGSLCQLPGN